ncbi:MULTISPECIES: hypothetical protein [Candidatus Ichthyocystis]|uniref:hypothetical protein n=1 Tax=Candidatus Ichthyocystis TaxID=2929841 RepID=UPI000B87A354|nr:MULTISPECIES: hypothetical protein [Ichthyocystis]
MQSNVNSTGSNSTSTVSSNNDVVSESAESEQAKQDRAAEDINVTKVLRAAASDTQVTNDAAQNAVRALGEIINKKSPFDSYGPAKLKMPSGYEYLENMSPEDAMVAVNNASSEIIDKAIQASVTRLKGSQHDYKVLHDRNMQKLEEYIEEGSSSIGDLILKILFFLVMIVIAAIAIAAAVLVPSPATIIAAISAIMGLINSGLSIASQVSGEDITFSGMLRQMAEGIKVSLVKDGMDSEKAEGVAKAIAGTTGIVTGMFLGDPKVLSMYFEGIAQSMGMTQSGAQIFGMIMSFIVMIALMGVTMNAGGAISSTATSVSAATTYLGSVDDVSKFAQMSADISQIAQVGLQVGQAGYAMYQAKTQYDKAKIKADLTKMRGFLNAMRDSRKREQDMMKQLITHMAEMQELTNQTIQSALKSSGVAFRNMV